MELLSVLFMSFLPLISLSLCLLIIVSSNRRTSLDQNLPPGNMGWPIIGETFEFLSSCWKGNPEKFVLDRMKQYSDKVFRTSLIVENMAVFCGADGQKFVFMNENKLVAQWWPNATNKIFPSSNQTSTAGEEAKKLRGLLPGFLKPEALIKYVPVMDSIAKIHLQTDWSPNKEVEAFPLSKRYTMVLACKLFFSLDDPIRVDKFSGLILEILAGIVSVPIDLPFTRFRRAVRAAKVIRRELLDIIKQRKIDLAEKRASPTQDIISLMLLTTDGNGKFLNEFAIADKMVAVLIGGQTASAAITFIVKYLGQFPDICDAVYREQMEVASSKKPGELLNWDDIQKMKYSWNVANEVMRLAPPVPGTFREVIADISYAGFTIPKGWKVYWNLYSTQKNPAYFPNPDTFDPSRFDTNPPAPYAFTPFGGGPRLCPGNEYARLEILVFMHHMVRMFKWETLIPDEKVIYNPGALPVRGVPVRLYPREAPSASAPPVSS